MHVTIDSTPLSNANANRGIGRYTKELVNALKSVKSPHTFSSSNEKTGTPDIIHYPFFDLFFPTLPLFHSSKTVVTIHDVIPLLFPTHYKPGIKGKLAFIRQKFAISRVNHIITDSDISRRDIHEKLHIPLDKISVVPLAASEEIYRPPQSVLDEVKKRFELPKDFLLYVGDINYNKNLPFLLRVVSKIPRLHLVLVGSQIQNTSVPEGKEISSLISSLRLNDRVWLLNSVKTTTDLSAIYSLATLYIQPSLYEGFGLPVLEAMKCKTPVLASCGGSLPEVAGQGALYFHPHDQDECEQVIRKALKMSPLLRNKLLKIAQHRAEQFTWQKTAQETIRVYESVLRRV